MRITSIGHNTNEAAKPDTNADNTNIKNCELKKAKDGDNAANLCSQHVSAGLRTS